MPKRHASDRGLSSLRVTECDDEPGTRTTAKLFTRDEAKIACSKKRMARPLRKWFRHDNLISLHQRIRSRGPPRPRWRSARPGPNKRAGAKGAIFLTRIPGCRSTVRPSRFPPPANIKGRSAHKDARPTSSNYASAEPAILKVFPCRMTAQAMRASLLASATTAAFLCILANRPRSHAPNEVGLSRSVGKAARAPWINICCPAC